METETNEIGNKIKTFRKLRNMKQEDLANASGINKATIQKYETGGRNPKPDQLKKIADALGISVNQFLPLEFSTAIDILAILKCLEKNAGLSWNCEKKEDGQYDSHTLSFSFKEDTYNSLFVDYLAYKDMMERTIATISQVDSDSKQFAPYTVNAGNKEMSLDETQARLLMYNHKFTE